MNNNMYNNQYQQPMNQGYQQPMYQGYQQPMYQGYPQPMYNPMMPVKSDGKATTSLVIGIISCLIAFILMMFMLPLPIIGLIIGCISKSRETKRMVAIFLNIVAIIIGITMTVLAVNGTLDKFLDEVEEKTEPRNEISGKYNCKGFSGTGESEDYRITLHLNNDKTFFYGPYGKTSNNYAKGTYTFEDENKTNGSGEYKYYMTTLQGDKDAFVVDGEVQDHDFYGRMEFGITTKNGKRQGIILFESSYQMYYCYEE